MHVHLNFEFIISVTVWIFLLHKSYVRLYRKQFLGFAKI